MEFIPPKGGIDFLQDKQKDLYKLVRAYNRGSAGPKVKKRLSSWTRGWSTKVNFVQIETIKRDEISILVFPRGKGRQKWVWVSGGVKTGPKRATNAPMPMVSYSPFTRPGPRPGPGGGRINPDTAKRVRFAKPTIIVARKFEEEAVKFFSAEYTQNILRLIRVAFR